MSRGDCVKIGIFADSYRPYVSGVVRSLELFRAQFDERGHETFVFAPDYQGTDPEPGVYRFRSVKAITYPSFRIAIPVSSNLMRRVQDLDLDLIHSHSPFLMGRAGARCAARLDMPLVFTYHTLYDEYLHYAPLGGTRWKRALDLYIRDFCSRCQVIIAPSSGLRDRIRRQGITTRIEVIPTGIPLDSSIRSPGRDWLRQRLNLDAATPVLLTLGRLGPEKNLPFLLETFRILDRDHPDAVLILVGDGPMRGGLEELSRDMGLSGKVLFTGPVAPEMTSHCYAGADLFLFASQSETQGLVVLEAKAAGLPVVTLANLSSDDLIITKPSSHRDGVVVDDLEPGAMARAISDLLNHPHRLRAMSASSLKNAPQFSAASWAGKVEALFTEVIRAGRKEEVV